jgi:hypothetical protein
MPPRDVEDDKRRLHFPRRDQRTFRLLPRTAGVPHPASPCPFQSPKHALVAAALRLPSGLVSRRCAADSTPDALFHPSAPLSAPQVPTEAMNFRPIQDAGLQIESIGQVRPGPIIIGGINTRKRTGQRHWQVAQFGEINVGMNDIRLK